MFGTDIPREGVAQISWAKKHPENFPAAYETMRFKKFNKQWPGVLFLLDGRIHINFERYWAMVNEACKAAA